MTDRTGKTLLALIAVALWGLLLRPLFTLPDAKAQSSARPPAPKRTLPPKPGVYSQEGRAFAAPTDSGNTLAVLPYEGKPIIVIRSGKISVWDVWNEGGGKFRLMFGDSKTLP